MIKENCLICGQDVKKLFNSRILNKYDVDYFYCDGCGFLHTEEPFWLHEAYSHAIADADTGLIARNIDLSKKSSSLLYHLFGSNGSYLDISGGYGVFTRLMRDIGFDYYWRDPYCENIFAKCFGVESNVQEYKAITAFEVLEHVNDPLAYIGHSLKEAKSRNIIFTTEVYTGDKPPKPGDWWYYSFPTGQHISFYARRTLEKIAENLNLYFYHHNNMFFLTEINLSSYLFKLITSRFSTILSKYVCKRMESKTFSDHEYIINKVNAE